MLQFQTQVHYYHRRPKTIEKHTYTQHNTPIPNTTNFIQPTSASDRVLSQHLQHLITLRTLLTIWRSDEGVSVHGGVQNPAASLACTLVNTN